MRRTLLLTGVFLSVAFASFGADSDWWWFTDKSYYDPLIAGVREPHISALALAKADRMAFMVKPDSPRRVWDIDVGAELPIAGREPASSVGPRMGPGRTGFGFWIPIDFHMIEDFVDHSAPIVNTDYRFGVMFKLQHGLPD